MTFIKYNDRLADVLTTIRDELIPWANADMEASAEAGAEAQGLDDATRVRKLEEAERKLEEAWK